MPRKLSTTINRLKKSKLVNEVAKQAKQLVKKEVQKRVVKSIVPKTVNYVGGRLGVAPNVSRAVGNIAAAHIGRIIGSGDYTMNNEKNSLTTGRASLTRPEFSGRSHRVTHREFIADIKTATTAGAFNNTQFVVNPGNFTTFPLVASIAQLYEKYKLHGVVFEYISLTGQYASATLGEVIMSSLQNTSAPQPTNATMMKNTENAISARSDTNALYGIECKNQSLNWQYVPHMGSNTKPNNNVANIYDLADFNIATYGGTIAANTIIGELWVTVDVEFDGPRMSDQRPSILHHTSLSGITASTPFGTIDSATRTAGTLTSATLSAGGLITFGNATAGDVYLVKFKLGGGATTIPGAFLSPTNCENPKILENYTTGYETALATTESILLVACYLTGPNSTLQFNITTTVATSVDLLILPISYGLVSKTLV